MLIASPGKTLCEGGFSSYFCVCVFYLQCGFAYFTAVEGRFFSFFLFVYQVSHFDGFYIVCGNENGGGGEWGEYGNFSLSMKQCVRIIGGVGSAVSVTMLLV